jgi:hypothetical protein
MQIHIHDRPGPGSGRLARAPLARLAAVDASSGHI